MPKPLSHDEVRNTVQSLVGPGFKVILSLGEIDYISNLTGQYLERALIQAVLDNLIQHNAPQKKIHLYKKRIDEINKDLNTKENAKNEMKYKYSWDETDKELWDKPEDCKKCKDGWMIDYNGVSKYPCHCVKGQEKKNKVTNVDSLLKSYVNANVVPIDSYMHDKYYGQEQATTWSIAGGSLGSAGFSTGASTNTQEKQEKHEHLHEVIKITPEPKGRRFRKPVSS
jgi:hypothetical protein